MRKKRQKITKGMPSAVLLSIVIHAALFLLAGMLVVFTVVKKKEIEFEPPKAAERPKMKLKKPKPRIKKSARPKQAKHILAKVNPVNMPEIQLPELSGMGGDGGLGDGWGGGFDTLPDLDDVSIFGSGQTIGNDLEGTLYDLKRDRRGKPLSVRMDVDTFRGKIDKFVRSGWKPSVFAPYYRSQKKLYSPSVMFPPMHSQLAPLAFNEPEMAGYAYLIHYKGQLVHPEGRRFRFWGMGDNCMLVRVDGRVVLDAGAGTQWGNQFASAWDGKESKMSTYHLGLFNAWMGDWIDLEPGIPLEMEVVLGEYDGGLFGAMLVVEEEGVEYPRNSEAGPMLPIFKTAELTRDQIDAIYKFLPEDRYAVTNGTVFSDYVVSNEKAVLREAPATNATGNSVVSGEQEEPPKVRTWTLKSGKTMEAELVMQLGSKTVLKTARGKHVKLPTSGLSEEDLDYLELENPPPLKLTFLKDTDRFDFPDVLNRWPVPKLTEITAGVKIEKESMKPYTKQLRVELFTFAAEIDGDNFMLLDRQEEIFVFSEETGKSLEVWGKKSSLYEDLDRASRRRGTKWKGHMIVVADERGEIIAQDVSNDWMLDIIGFLRTFPVGRHFSKEGERVYPPRPKTVQMFW